MRRALITGINGQDGSYLAELLLARPDYEVHGLVRPASLPRLGRLAPLLRRRGARDRLVLHRADLADGPRLAQLVAEVRPDEVYHLAAQSHVRVSFDLPLATAETIAMGSLRLLEAVRRLALAHPVRYYQASSAEMFGAAPPPQSLETPFRPRSPYAAAKLFAHWQTVNHRDAYGLFACSGILFNHESPRRGLGFVSRKITRAAARIKLGLQRRLRLGNLDAERDWGFAGDYVKAMWLMLQQDEPGDYVVATGLSHSVRDLLRLAFELVGLDYREFVDFDPRFARPSDVPALRGDASKARDRLGWRPEVEFPRLIAMMVEHDLARARRERDRRRP
jgi:GDPmannose 4,6-dehydratase